MLRTQTRSSRVAISLSELTPRIIGKAFDASVIMSYPPAQAAAALRPSFAAISARPPASSTRRPSWRSSRPRRSRCRSRRIDRARRWTRTSRRARPTRARDWVRRVRPRRRAASDHACEMLAQCVSHGAEGLVDIGVVRLAADDEEHIGLREPVLVADAATSFIFS